ncbi:MAG: trypsin-like peptidase domain-containing protein [Acidobacteria bacterium]|nr:trypsin-like peptidase domain-containing protein [Acidobacteriota bacterium]MBV9069702.1 trypsin-like peptidase domain-containing protein [Acidobacteriota bacterium]MBV9187411.1 trypsin-like peptidase domain-containing protein [Acidobacteriota bacterium]
MNPTTKRILSTIAIIIASVTFGVVVSADLGLMRPSHAQSSVIQTTSSGAPVASVTIPSFADVAARVMPAVVSITSTEVIKSSDLRKQNPFGGDPFEFFFPNPGQGNGNGPRNPHGNRTPEEDDEHKQVAGGSGFIISPDGYIVTNNHVIDGASKVQVHWGADENGTGGHTSEAKIIGRDPATDIALLKIDAGQSLPSVPLGDSDRIRKGDWAIAVGNPFQFENTLTVGVISAKGRTLGLGDQTRSFENFIQTDAAINFGNSGGPLMNINGEVVGINTAIRGGGAQGLGFATPINTAKRLLPQLKQGKVIRGYLGMGILDLSEDARAGFELPPDTRGALVQTVEAGKPAAKAGIQPGDIIVEADGHPIISNRALIDYISYLPVGSKINLTVIRDGKRQTLTASTIERTLEADKADPDKQPEEVAPARNKLGMSVQELTPQMRQQYGIADNVTGVVVTGVKEVSAAGDVLTEGDVISEVQGTKISNLAQFRAAIDRLRGGQIARIYVTSSGRGGAAISGFRFIHVP